MALPSPEFQEKLSSISERELKKYYITLTHYVALKCRYVRGVDPENIVGEAIVDILAGKRNNPSGKEFGHLLNDVVRSKVDHILKSKEVKPGYAEEMPPRVLSVQEISNRNVYCKEVLKAMRVLARNDPDLLKLIDVIEDEPGVKPREMALRLGVPIKKIGCLKKRFDRRVENIRKGKIRWVRPKKR